MDIITTSRGRRTSGVARTIPAMLLAAVLIAQWAVVCRAAAETAPSATPPKATERKRPVVAVLVPQDREWLLTVAAPLVGKLRAQGALAVLIAVSWPASPATVTNLKRISPERCLVLAAGSQAALPKDVEGLPSETMSVADDPLASGALVAKQGWEAAEQVYLASLDEPDAVLRASALAAHDAVPFFPLSVPVDEEKLAGGLTALGARTVSVVLRDQHASPSWLKSLPLKARVIDCRGADRKLVATIGRAKVRTVVLARIPDPAELAGKSAWLAPFVSVVRNAPLVLCGSGDAADAEAQVAGFIKKHKLKPRSVTILADYESIGTVTVTDRLRLGEYQVDVEPCMVARDDEGISLAVGRIPCRGLQEASMLVVRGLVWKRRLGTAKPRVVMVANPNAEYGALPLCETVSRATARDLKNLGMHVDEFYRRPSNALETLEAARNAHVIIYQGHVTDQRIFEDPSRFFEQDWWAPPDSQFHDYWYLFEPTQQAQWDARYAMGDYLPGGWGSVHGDELPTEAIADWEHSGDRRHLIGEVWESLPLGQRPAEQLEPIRLRLPPDWPRYGVPLDQVDASGPPPSREPVPGGPSALPQGTAEETVDQPARLLECTLGDDQGEDGGRAEDHHALRGADEYGDEASLEPPVRERPQQSAFASASPDGDGEYDSPLPSRRLEIRDLEAEVAPDAASMAQPPMIEQQLDRLEGLPLVVLQSCHSLENEVARRAFDAGAVALLGSVTNIHSASGSAFIKAFCDGLLYRGSTVGEALRDARNYFLCLGQLKAKRGHTEQPKVHRAALSFRLWGDPELRVTRLKGKPPSLPAVSAAFQAPDKVVVSTPAKRLGKSSTSRYFTRMFPGTETAGIVKRLKHKPIRRITSVYFFRLPLPKDFVAQGFTQLSRPGDTSQRAAFLVDEYRRFLYLVYFPDKERPGESFELVFGR